LHPQAESPQLVWGQSAGHDAKFSEIEQIAFPQVPVMQSIGQLTSDSVIWQVVSPQVIMGQSAGQVAKFSDISH